MSATDFVLFFYFKNTRRWAKTKERMREAETSITVDLKPSHFKNIARLMFVVFFTDVSGERIGPIFKSQAIRDPWRWDYRLCRNVGGQLYQLTPRNILEE
jgi:hypothetical protein